MNLNPIPYREFKDKYILSEVGDLFEKLDSDLLRIQSMLGSKYVSQIKLEVEEWEKKLLNI